MPSRDASCDREAVVKHQHSWSENGRSNVPMWDSSDPDRAPPPLPLNPGSQSPTTKPNTSASIATAAQKIADAAKASAPLSSYTRNQPLPRDEPSPERSLIKGAHHKRMQTFSSNSVRDLRAYLDGAKKNSSDSSPERPKSGGAHTPLSSKGDAKDYFQSSPEKDRITTPTPTSKTMDPFKETPALRPSARQRSIYGENTPPSATMLALQTMQVPEPFNDITNARAGTPPATAPRVSTQYDFSAQLLNLTSIASSLQREMAQLSRRSKDNATDLISLKEATNSRDEDIRKSLKDLSKIWSSTNNLLGPPPLMGEGRSRSSSTFATPNFLDSKAFSSPPSAAKGLNLPRAASAHSFLEDHRDGSPSPYSIEGAASLAMLEKIIREMVTKEGSERLLSTLSELFEKSSKDNVDAAKKVEELADFIKQKSESSALVPVQKSANGGPPRLDINFDSPRSLTRTVSSDAAPQKIQELAADGEFMKTLNRIKESTQHVGGTTSEVKTIVRDLRGEVLGMGRDLGQKLHELSKASLTRLDQLSNASLTSALDRSITGDQTSLDAQEVHRIIEDAMEDLKEHLDGVISQNQSGQDVQLSINREAPAGAEMYDAVKAALAEHTERSLVRHAPDEGLDREAILETVKEGLKDFEPNIELQQYGLERDEILVVLKQGFEEYEKSRPDSGTTVANIDKGEIFEVVQEALKDFQPALNIDAQLQQMKDDILANVHQTLLELQPHGKQLPLHDEMTRAAIIDAVREGVINHGPAAPREIEISRDDLFDAVKASLDGTTIPFGGLGEKVLSQLHELVDEMKVEFKQYSTASGRDTEQVLDAVKDGLENLRAEIESYVDRAQDVTGKDEIVDTVKTGLEQLRVDVQGYCARGAEGDDGKREMLDYIRAEFEHLHEAMGTSRDEDGGQSRRTAEIIRAVRDGMDGLKREIASQTREGHDEEEKEEMFEAMKEEFEQLKTAILNAHASDKSELVETIQDSMGALHHKLNGSEVSGLSHSASEAYLREEFASLKETLHAGGLEERDRDAITSALRQSIDDMRIQLAGDQSDAQAEALGMIRAELNAFKESMDGTTISGGARSLDGYSEDASIGGVAEAIASLRRHISSVHEKHSSAQLDAIKVELDVLKDSMGSSVVVGGTNSMQQEYLEHIRTTVDNLKAKGTTEGGVPTELLEAIRAEFENLRNSIATSVIGGTNNEEVLDTIRLGLDDLRSDMQKRLDNPELGMARHSELLDAMNDGLESMKSELTRTIDKPLDMTVNYEILDTLKDGIASLRADMDTLKGPNASGNGAVVLADGTEAVSRELPTTTSATVETIKKTDLEKTEVLLTQLQIKIEALGASVHEMPDKMPRAPAPTACAEDAIPKDNLINLEAMIRDIQGVVAGIAAKEHQAPPPPEGVAMKEDTDAIETILRNTKAQLEDLNLPDGESLVTKDQIDSLEASIRLTHETLDTINDKLEASAARKEDVAVVEVLAQDIKLTLEEIKDKVCSTPEDDGSKPITKSDFDILGVICTEIKAKLLNMELPDPEDAPSKADFDQLRGLISDFRESHDKMRESYENDIAVTAKAFDDRKQESEALSDRITSVKDFLQAITAELLGKFGEGDVTVSSIGESLRALEEKVPESDAIRADIDVLVTKVTEEFEKAHDSLEAIKADNAQTAEAALEKQAEHKGAVVDELGVKLETLFDSLMSKYDDAQISADLKATALEEKIAAQEELMTTTQAMADELRVSIDTLGGSLTSFTESFPAKIDAMEDQSKTVFSKAEESIAKVDQVHMSLLGEHAGTREDIIKVLTAVGGVHSDITEHNPRFMVKLEELAAVMGQHWEHSQKTAQAAEQHTQAVRELQDQVRGLAEDSKTQAEGWAPHFEELKSNISGLPALLPAPADSVSTSEKYDDTLMHEKLDKILLYTEGTGSEKFDDAAVHEKLDKLMGHAQEAGQASAQLERLDQIHEKVMSTAAEVSAFVAMQTRQIMNDHESKEKEAEEIALLLERRGEQKDHIEAEIHVMNEEKDVLQRAVEQLRAEKEALATQKAQLRADVSSLETALHIRRDELHAMDAKADAIERRMLEGVMNQSRMLLLAKSAQKPSPKKKPGRDLRIPSDTSQRTATSTAPALKTSHAMAMKPRQQAPTANSVERRIMSLSQINNNVPTGAHAYKSLVPTLSSPSMKRSHSVKSHLLQRKASLGSKRNAEVAVLNKENQILSEEDEEGADRPVSRDGTFAEAESEGPSTRRQSYASAAGSVRTYDTNSYLTGETPTEDSRRSSYGAYNESDLSYGTGSYLTGSEIDRRTSLGSTVNGQVGATIDEESAEDSEEGDAVLGAQQEEDAEAPLQLEPPEAQVIEAVVQKSVYAPPSDSGLGSDLPTALVMAHEGGFFR